MGPLLVSVIAATLMAASPALAEFKIRAARIAEGDLWVMGEVDEPNTAITLDETYTERTDSRGRFQFRTPYHPATCTVLLKTARQARAVVIADCGQRGPAGPEGPPGPPGFRGPFTPEPDQHEPASLPVSCSRRAALYVAPNGFQVWVTRKGVIRYTSTARLTAARQEVVLQVSIGGETASLRGADYAAMLRGGPPQEIEVTTGQLINWERLVDALPTTIRIASETGTQAIAELTFKECGSAPVAPTVPPAAQAPRESPLPTRPLPQGALPSP